MEELAVANIEQPIDSATIETETKIENKDDGIEVSTFSVENVELDSVIDEGKGGEHEECNNEFNPESFELDKEEVEEDKEEKDEDPELFCGYDLKKFDHELDLSDPADESYIKSILTEFNDNGIKQEDVNCVLNILVREFDKEDAEDEANRKREELEMRSHKRVQDTLKKELTTEEKRNYKSVYSWVKAIEGESVPQELIVEAMSNPALVRMFHSLYKKAVNTNQVKDVQQQNTKASNVTPQAVKENWVAWIGSQKGAVSKEDSKAYVSKFLPMIKADDVAEFETIFKSILK